MSADPRLVVERKRGGGSASSSSSISASSAVVNGVPVGVLAGYLSTWDPDTGGKFGVPDQFVRGAWTKSIAEHKARGNRQVRFKDNHGQTVGGFPIETVEEDGRGLFGVAHVNLDTRAGRELYSLARQGVITDFSVGYTAIRDKVEGGVRRIYEARLWEASGVDEPANPRANILEVRELPRERDLPLASSVREEALLGDIVRNLRGARDAMRRGPDRKTRVAPARRPIDDVDAVLRRIDDAARALRSRTF